MANEKDLWLTTILFKARPRKRLGLIFLLLPLVTFLIIPGCFMLYQLCRDFHTLAFLPFGLLFFIPILSVYYNYIPYAIFDELMSDGSITLRGLPLKNMEKSGRFFFRGQLVVYVVFWVAELSVFFGNSIDGLCPLMFFSYLLYGILSPWILRELTLWKVRSEFRKSNHAYARYQAILFYREAKLLLKQKLLNDKS